jgi:hypothetical protein
VSIENPFERGWAPSSDKNEKFLYFGTEAFLIGIDTLILGYTFKDIMQISLMPFCGMHSKAFAA